MAASLADEDTPDEPAVHPGWYAVAEGARLDAETRPTPTVKPARVSIMDFFSAVAPTGAEAEADVEATVVMDPVDETLVMPAAAIAEAASEAVKADEDTDSEAASAEEESPAKKETAKKAASTKAATKKAPAKKVATKKGTAKKTAPKKAAAKKTSGAGPATNE